MKRLFVLLPILLNIALAQMLELNQLWQISEDENVWVVRIAQQVAPELYRADIVEGDIPEEHDYFVRVDATATTTAFTFMFNNLMMTDSGSGFKCSANQANEGTLERYIGTVGGSQWSEEKESCTIKLQAASEEPR